MKKNKLTIIASLTLVLLVSAVSAMAQSANQSAKVSIPFAFSVGDTQLPAGTYVVSKNGNTLLIQNTRGKGSAATLAGQTIANSQETLDGRLVFNRYNDQYFLSEIWMPGAGLGRELKVRANEIAAAGANQRDRTEVTIAGR